MSMFGWSAVVLGWVALDGLDTAHPHPAAWAALGLCVLCVLAVVAMVVTGTGGGMTGNFPAGFAFGTQSHPAPTRPLR
jgi:hypothetical protein